MKKNPAVSILIPTYNYARYLPAAIESALDQDFTDFEVVISDDASTDNTEKICRSYEAKDSRIRFVRHKKNLGMVENWNWCLQQARGTYIKYLLADDKFNRPYALRRLVEAMSLPGVALAASARELMDENSRTIGMWNSLGLNDHRVDGRVLSAQCLERSVNRIGEPTAVLFRKADAVRGFDVTFRQLVDLEMWLHLLQKGDLAYLAEPLCCFRRHAGQQTEVNREAGLHLPELTRLGGYMPEAKTRRMRFRWMYQMKKCGLPEYQESLALLRETFSPGAYAYSCLEYKFLRIGENTRHFFCSRMWRKRAKTSVSA
ncbi:MAG: glycosyltransferase family 2 protein [Kiritimatiellales bacterium]|nr:glycosyltransferase family 2 protein [Kiritimatiellales bacterium]